MKVALLPCERYRQAIPITAQDDCDPFLFSPVLRAPAMCLTSRANARVRGIGTHTNTNSGVDATDPVSSIVVLAGRTLLLGSEAPCADGCNVRDDGDRCVGDSEFEASYSRWLLMWMPLLGLACGGSVAPVRIDNLIVPPLRHSWQYAMLERVAPRDIRIIERDSHDLVCEALFQPEVPGEPELLMNRMTPALLKHAWVPESPCSSRRLYIEQSGDLASRIDNVSALHAMLDAAGFERMSVDTLQVDELAAACSTAAVLISANPELLANMVFCRPGTPVIELIGSRATPTSYRLATLCGHHYHAVLADPHRQYAALVSSRFACTRSRRGEGEACPTSARLPLDALAQLLEQTGSVAR